MGLAERLHALQLVLRPKANQVPDLGRELHGTRALADSYLMARPQEDGAPPSPSSGSRAVLQFAWPSIWAGPYDLDVRCRGASTPLLVVTDVDAAARTGHVARLPPIDLRGKLRVIAVTVLNEADQPLPAGEVLILVDQPDPNAELAEFAVDEHGSTEIVTGLASVDLLVTATNRQPRALRGVRDDTTVHLARYPEITLRLVGDAPEIPEGAELTLAIDRTQARPRDGRRYSGPNHSGGVDGWLSPRPRTERAAPNRDLTFVVEGDGTYRVRAALRLPGQRRSLPIDGVEPATIVSVRRVPRRLT